MNKSIILFLLFVCNTVNLSAQDYCNLTEDCLFWEVQTKNLISSTDIIYATNVPKIDDFPVGFGNINLKLDLYHPELTPEEKRPLIISVHGGGFFGGHRNENTNMAKDLASRGYVVANIDYRLCEKVCCKLWLNVCQICIEEILKTRYIATLDALTAAQYLIANADQYHIDTDNIFLVGTSAGAVVSLTAAFMDQEEVNATFPALPAIWGAFPEIQGVKAVASIAGALMDTLSITASDTTAAFFAHGTCDQIVVYDTGGAYNCNNLVDLSGGAACARRMQNLGLNYQMFTGIAMDHNANALIDIWFDEMLNFFRRTLCGENIQKHVIETLEPSSIGCLIINQSVVQLPIVDPIPDFNCTPVANKNPNINTAAIKFYPNPATSFVDFKNDSEANLEFSICNVHGKIVYKRKIGLGNFRIPVHTWAKGIYLVFGTSKNKSFSQKLLIN